MKDKQKYFANADVIKEHFSALDIKYRDFDGSKNRINISGLSVAYLTKMLSTKKSVKKSFSREVYENLAREITFRYRKKDNTKNIVVDPDTLIDHGINKVDKKIIFYLERYDYCNYNIGFEQLMVFNEARINNKTSKLIEEFIYNLRHGEQKVNQEFKDSYLTAEEQIAKIKTYAKINEGIDLLKKEKINIFIGKNSIPQIIWCPNTLEQKKIIKPLFLDLEYLIVLFSDNPGISYYKLKYSSCDKVLINKILSKFPCSIKHNIDPDGNPRMYPQPFDNVEHQKIISKMVLFYMENHHDNLIEEGIDSGYLPFAWNYSEEIEGVVVKDNKDENLENSKIQPGTLGHQAE